MQTRTQLGNMALTPWLFCLVELETADVVPLLVSPAPARPIGPGVRRTENQVL